MTVRIEHRVRSHAVRLTRDFFLKRKYVAREIPSRSPMARARSEGRRFASCLSSTATCSAWFSGLVRETITRRSSARSSGRRLPAAARRRRTVSAADRSTGGSATSQPGSRARWGRSNPSRLGTGTAPYKGACPECPELGHGSRPECPEIVPSTVPSCPGSLELRQNAIAARHLTEGDEPFRFQLLEGPLQRLANHFVLALRNLSGCFERLEEVAE
jgi:hypothetical protein